MNYILNKFEAGEVISKGFVCGWEFEAGFDGNYEHRPLMQDAMDELLKAGYVTGRHVEATREARELNNIGPEEAYTRFKPMHSVSVGDILVEDCGTVSIVAGSGFDKLEGVNL